MLELQECPGLARVISQEVAFSAMQDRRVIGRQQRVLSERYIAVGSSDRSYPVRRERELVLHTLKRGSYEVRDIISGAR